MSQVLPGVRLPSLMVSACVLVLTVRLLPVHVVDAFGDAANTSPTGNTSVKLTPVSVTGLTTLGSKELTSLIFKRAD